MNIQLGYGRGTIPFEFEEVRHMRTEPARTVEEALARAGADEPGYVLPRGAAYMPFVAG